MVIPGHGSAQPFLFDTHIDLDTMLHIRPVKTLSQWLLVAIVGLAAGVAYAGPDKDKDGDRKPRDPGAVSAAKAAQNACSGGEAFADLDVNNVRARLYNTGNLFYGSAGTAGTDYEIPRGSGLSPLYAHGIWVGGQADGDQPWVSGQLRETAAVVHDDDLVRRMVLVERALHRAHQ